MTIADKRKIAVVWRGDAEALALRAGCFQSSFDPLRNADSLLLGDRGDDGDYRVLENPARIEILLSETAIANAKKPILNEFFM